MKDFTVTTEKRHSWEVFFLANLCGLGFASLGEGGVARRSRVTEGVSAESGREMTLAGFVAAATPSDSPSASHLPQEEGFGLRRFASEGGVVSR
jgi:hypothetical protein